VLNYKLKVRKKEELIYIMNPEWNDFAETEFYARNFC
jgi:hypothetical protein